MATLDGRYELGAQLGSGGMARVFAAVDRHFDRTVAIKLVGEGEARAPALRARLLREARAAASFNHPCAVTVYDVGEDSGEPFIVMELVRGRSLAEELAWRGALPVEEALLIADRVLAALQAAHARGLVHRDVKPGNVLLGDGGAVKLTDFGIAKDVYDATSALTVTGQVVGTPRYLAPEQAAGQPATPQTDLYATGLLLFEMLAGRAPFQASSAVAVALAHQQAPPPPLGRARPDVPRWLEAAVQRALSKAPRERFPSAAAFRSALRGPSHGVGPARALTLWRRRQQGHSWWAHQRSRGGAWFAGTAAVCARTHATTTGLAPEAQTGVLAPEAQTAVLAATATARRGAQPGFAAPQPARPGRAGVSSERRGRPRRLRLLLVAALALLLLAAAGGLSLRPPGPGLTGVQTRIANPSLERSPPVPATLPAPPGAPGAAEQPESPTVAGSGTAPGGDQPEPPAVAGSDTERDGAQPPEASAGNHPHGGPPGHARARGSGAGRGPPEHAAASSGRPGLRGRGR